MRLKSYRIGYRLRQHLTRAWCLAPVLFLPLLATAGDAKLHERVMLGTEPAWVLPAEEKPSLALTNSDASEILLLWDKQMNASSQQSFVRMVRRILSNAGVQKGSQFSVAFDPAYSSVQLHRLQIHRDGQVLNRLAPEKIQVLQRERELERYIYSGQLSVVIFLDDVRPGDEIESAYTVTGSNPIFDGKFFDSLGLQWPVAVSRFRFRLLWPEGRDLFVRTQRADLKPATRKLEQLTEYLWEVHDVAPLLPEPGIPMWYDPYPRLQLSEFATWQQTAEWAARVYKSATQLSPELDRQIADWKSQAPSSDALILTALQFVQDEVRYLGVEVGKQSHEPTDPSTVFARRFGDCKDKSLLLCATLRRLGFEASPALVNTEARQRIEQEQPSPLAFNHVIVRLSKDGQTFWLDPTLSYQRGPLTHRFVPDYGYALVAEPGVTNLSIVSNGTNGWPRTIVRESFALKGTNSPSELRVTTTLEGIDAEDFRGWLARAGRAEVEKALLTYQTRIHAEVEAQSPMQVHDSRDDGVIQVEENYRISGIWRKRDGWRVDCELYPSRLGELLHEPMPPYGKMPIGVSYPRQHLHVIGLELPDHIRLRDESKTIRGPAEELSFKRISFGRSMRLEYDYRALADSVPAQKAGEHVRARSEMQECLGTSLIWSPPGNPFVTRKHTRHPLLEWGSLGFGSLMFITWRIVRRREPEQEI